MTDQPYPQDPQAEDIAWAAGLFEGEGSIVPRREGKGALITIAMTDRDVVDRFCRVVGTGRVYKVRPAHDGWKTAWRCDITKTEDVLRVVAMLRPYFGERRTKRADEVIGQLERHIERIIEPRPCKACGRTISPPIGSNAERRVFCDWRCSNRYHGARRVERRRLAAIVDQLQLGGGE